LSLPATLARIYFLVIATVTILLAQGRGGAPPGPPPPPPTPRAAAPIDITGYWVAMVTEDWRYRMAVPPKGDFIGVPVNQAARDAGKDWDPAKDEAAGEQCKAYGVGGLMRMPTRLNISWQDDTALKIQTDAGTQTRMLNFKPSALSGGDWQGVSNANWERQISVMGAGRGGPPPGGSLKVVTTKMKPGYLRKNGVPYSANAVITEYFDRFDQPNGDSILIVITEVEDPTYLLEPFITSTHLRKQADGTGFAPSACAAR